MANGYVMCDTCAEQPARLRVTVSKMNGEVLDKVAVCKECLASCSQEFSIGDGPLETEDERG